MMTTGSFETKSPKETEALGKRVAGELAAGDVVGLIGELGSGKTCFVRGVAGGLGSEGLIKSPSFTIINIYEGGRLPLHHIDLYRIARTGEFFDTGVEEYIYGEGVSVIEWADNVPGLLERCDLVIRFSHRGDDLREIEIKRRGAGEG